MRKTISNYYVPKESETRLTNNNKNKQIGGILTTMTDTEVKLREFLDEMQHYIVTQRGVSSSNISYVLEPNKKAKAGCYTCQVKYKQHLINFNVTHEGEIESAKAYGYGIFPYDVSYLNGQTIYKLRLSEWADLLNK